MIVGAVAAGGREATIDLVVHGPGGDEGTVRAIIDTGFTGALTLPAALVESLGLRVRGAHRGVLADGRAVVLDLYEARVLWDGRPRRVPVLATGSEPLVGVGLLSGYELTVQVVDGGRVRIAALAPA